MSERQIGEVVEGPIFDLGTHRGIHIPLVVGAAHVGRPVLRTCSWRVGTVVCIPGEGHWVVLLSPGRH